MARLRLVLIWLLCLVASTYTAIRMLYAIATSTGRAWALVLAHHQLLNAACGNDPDQCFGIDETAPPVSSRFALAVLWIRCLAIAAFAALAMLEFICSNPAAAWVLAVSHDQLANAATNGNRKETISSRANRARKEGRRWGCILCRLLDAADPPNHCERSAGI